MSRGVLNEQAKAVADELLDWDIDTKGLRLLPYIQYQMMNDQRLDPNLVSPAERDTLAMFRERGWIEGGASGLKVSKKFWDAINQILWWTYVDYER